jgi:hypothetical protein
LALLATLPVAAAVALWLVGSSAENAAPVAGAPVALAPVAVVDVQAEPTSLSPERAEPAAEANASAQRVAAEESLSTPREVAMLPLDRASRPAAKTRVTSRPQTAGAAPAPEPPTEAPERAEPPLVPAAELGSRPAHPSIGAAQAAVGSTLGSARLCVVGQLAPSQAAVVFGSNGRVLSIRVSGAAADTAAESCIQRAMAQARVQPFTDETFSVRTTVRP